MFFFPGHNIFAVASFCDFFFAKERFCFVLVAKTLKFDFSPRIREVIVISNQCINHSYHITTQGKIHMYLQAFFVSYASTREK